MSAATKQAKKRQPQSAAAPSPFTPIADYAFLSNCHTGALIAPDGGIDWLCMPSFDSPSAFGSLLDREAGTFRIGPFGIHHPTARVYEPGTNVLETTWKTPSGWIVVRDALTMGPRGHDDEITPHTRPPADDDADHVLVRTVECLEGRVEVELVCEPAFDYGRTPAEWTLLDGGRDAADATGAGQTIRLRSDLALGVEGSRVRARHVLEAGDRAFCSLSWAEQLAGPRTSTTPRPGSPPLVRPLVERGDHAGVEDLALEAKWRPVGPGVPDRPDPRHQFADAGRRIGPGHRETLGDVRGDLAAEAEDESTTGQRLQVPADVRESHRRAGDAYRVGRPQGDRAGVLGGGGKGRERVVLGLEREAAVVPASSISGRSVRTDVELVGRHRHRDVHVDAYRGALAPVTDV